jgi:hypothetical protein
MDYPKTIKKVNGHPWIYHASFCFRGFRRAALKSFKGHRLPVADTEEQRNRKC